MGPMLEFYAWRRERIVLFFTRGQSIKEIAGYFEMTPRRVNHVLNVCGINRKTIKQVRMRAL